MVSPFRIILTAGLLLVLTGGCDSSTTPQGRRPPNVGVVRPEQRDVLVQEICPGLTEAVRSVELVPQVQAVLEQILYKPGSLVQEGDPLFILEKGAFQARVAAAEAALAGQRASLKQASTEYERNLGLYREQAVSQTVVVSWRERLSSAQAGVRQAEAELKEAAINLEHTTIRAPFSGRISKANVQKGALVGPEGGSLATLSTTDPMYAVFSVNPVLVPFLGAGSPKLELAVGDGTFSQSGHVEYLAPEVTASSGTLLVRGVFPNPENTLLPGEYVRIRITTASFSQAILVPRKALSRDQQGFFLYTVSPDNTVHRTAVETGPESGDAQIILKGLPLDSRVVVSGMTQLRTGEQVNVISSEK